MSFLAFGIAFVVTVLLIPVIRRWGKRSGQVAQPRADRWHKKPTPVLGGVGIFSGFLIGLGVTMISGAETFRPLWGLLAGSTLMFALGIYDDFKQITPPVKLIGQIAAAAVIVFSGYTTKFFPGVFPNILISMVWLIGITNAINLLDNMDGLAGGISLIAALFLSYFFWHSLSPQSQGLLPVSLALAGSILGFLVYNFPPASIFMGDSGSLFIGVTLASLAIARTPQASNVFAVMSVPTLIFLLPILDTALVTFTRLLRGQSPAQGGRDHTSHRLVAFGLTERQAVLVLYGIAIASGVSGAAIEALDYEFSLVVIPILVLSFALLAAYLGRLKVIGATRPGPATPPARGMLANFMADLTYKRRMLEIALDFFIISIAYYMAFWTRFGFTLDEANTDLLLASMPIALGSSYLSFFVFGVYRGVWRYFGVEDLTRFARAVLGSIAIVAGFLLTFRPSEAYSPVTFFLFAIFLFLGLAASRSSFRLLDQVFNRQSATQVHSSQVLIYGAGDVGEMALRWMLRNPDLGYRPAGFLDDDPLMWGRRIHGVAVLGGLGQLESLLKERNIDGIIVTFSMAETQETTTTAIALCRSRGIWVRALRLEFELVE